MPKYRRGKSTRKNQPSESFQNFHQRNMIRSLTIKGNVDLMDLGIDNKYHVDIYPLRDDTKQNNITLKDETGIIDFNKNTSTISLNKEKLKQFIQNEIN